MSKYVTGLTYGGQEWTPQFITEVDPMKCMGCGRCVKVCAQKSLGIDMFEDEDDMQRMVAIVANQDSCSGCQACGRVCVKHCHRFEPKLA
ncbi:4Fe-4S dicluster domain-containing protein [Heliorestis convoluta]|uniref:Putative ferredoxin III, nif-specific n=1 Tax=Heliorestis convoluta TaxID=356322 RepID=A0A5Q2N120_9FIRM|nr:4Fe-4S dicluster domain-containing protein [Heliorestis convoluta]QGG48557.1 putative ferredoxin III, nif-specific [Heliorestis convoluta]